MSRLDDLWRELAGPARTALRPDFRIDPAFRDTGGAEDGTLYARLHRQAPHIDAGLARIVTHPELKALIAAGDPDAPHLAFELIRLGAPLDTRIADFSMQAYLDWHPDIARAGMNPLVHYLRHAVIEGHHRSLAELRDDLHEGARPFDPDRDTVLICLPALDGPAARDAQPVILRMLREASAAQNAVVATLGGGALLAEVLAECCALQITRKPLLELPHAAHEAFGRADRAILHGAASAWFIHHCVARDLPFAAYLDEHVEDTPPWQIACLTGFADLLVFSSEHLRDNWRGRFADIGFDAATDSAVIPPRPMVAGDVTEARRTRARQAVSRAIGRDLGEARLICGAGPVRMRSGTEIFAQTAQIAAGMDPDSVFVWIGDGPNHQEMGYGVHLDLQLRRMGANGPGASLFLLPEGPRQDDLLDAADAIFVPARLGPLPLAAFEAVGRGCHVVCFAGATGLDDPAHRATGRIRATPHGDPLAAARALLALPRKAGRAPGPGPEGDEPSFFSRIDAALRDRLSRQRHFVLGGGAFDIPILFTKSDPDRPLRRREREKMFGYGRRLLWRDAEDARTALAASDSWVHARIRVEDQADLEPDLNPGPGAALPDYSIHIHAYYTDDLAPDLLSHAPAFAGAARIVVTTDAPDKAESIRRIGDAQGLDLRTRLVANRGRDILPFLQLFAADGPGCDGIWCHLHQKRSVQTTGHGDVWKRFLHRILLGDEDRVSNALARIARPGTGLVAAFEPHHLGWGDSRRLLPGVAGAFPGPLPEAPLLFPVGNMFWTRGGVARAMLDLWGEDHPWPNEPIATDGTVFHLIERLWPAVAARMGLDSVFLHKADEERV